MHRWIDGGVEYGVEYGVEDGRLWHDTSVVQALDTAKVVDVLIAEVERLAARNGDLERCLLEVYHILELIKSINKAEAPLE